MELFTKTEQKEIRETIKLQGVANKISKKFGSCSRNYVGQVLQSNKKPKTKKAIAIYLELKNLHQAIVQEVCTEL